MTQWDKTSATEKKRLLQACDQNKNEATAYTHMHVSITRKFILEVFIETSDSKVIQEIKNTIHQNSQDQVPLGDGLKI